MKVFALVGPTGTGKSHHAVMVSKKVNAKAIIDDGLLIVSNKVAAGRSAKREETKMASVRRAIFSDQNHVDQVKNAIKEHDIDSILILGTSEEMAARISKALGLGNDIEYIHIEEVSTPQDIELAKNMRMSQGKHVIPVPTFEIKKDFSGYFLHPLRIFRRRQGKNEEIDTKTVVRPTYSYMGNYTISDNAIVQMVLYETTKTPGIMKASAIVINNSNGAVEIDLNVSVKLGVPIPQTCKNISDSVVKQIEKMTALSICKINITVKDLVN